MSRWSAIAGVGRRAPRNADFVDLLEMVLVAAVLVFAGLLELHRGGSFAAYRLFNDALLAQSS